MDTITNYIYLLQLREFIKTKENIYKVGRTSKQHLERFNQYPKGSLLLFQMICNCSKTMEIQILEIFKDKFIQRKDIGNEYFEGEYNKMIDLIYITIKNENERFVKIELINNIYYISYLENNIIKKEEIIYNNKFEIDKMYKIPLMKINLENYNELINHYNINIKLSYIEGLAYNTLINGELYCNIYDNHLWNENESKIAYIPNNEKIVIIQKNNNKFLVNIYSYH